MKLIPPYKTAIMRLKRMPVRELSRKTKIPRRTLRDILSGKTKNPKPATKAKLTRHAKKLSLSKVPIRGFSGPFPMPTIYEEDVHVVLDSGKDADDNWNNNSKWEDLWHKIKRPVLRRTYHHGTFAAVFDVYSAGNVIQANMIRRDVVDAEVLMETVFLTMLMHIIYTVRQELGIHISQGEGVIVVKRITLSFYPRR